MEEEEVEKRWYLMYGLRDDLFIYILLLDKCDILLDICLVN